MYKIRVRRTKPQGLLFLVFLLMFIVMALNIIVYQLTPQYTTYGNQHYVVRYSIVYEFNININALYINFLY